MSYYVILCHLLYVLFLLLFLLLFFLWQLFFLFVTIISIFFLLVFIMSGGNPCPMRWAMTVKCPWAPAKLHDQQESSLYQAKSRFEAEWQLVYVLFLYYTYYFDCLTRFEQLVTSTYALQDNMSRIYDEVSRHCIKEESSHCWHMGPIHAIFFCIICIMSLLHRGADSCTLFQKSA